MLNPDERAEKLVTKYNAEGAALSNTEENYLQTLIASEIRAAVEEAVTCNPEHYDEGYREGKSEAYEEAADICDQEATVEGIAQKCAERIRALKEKA